MFVIDGALVLTIAVETRGVEHTKRTRESSALASILKLSKFDPYLI